MSALTIGLPVYNGARSLAGSLDRLLGQSFGEFDLTICDNASSDATADICAEYLRRDSRVSYYRQPETVIWSENFRFLLERAQTPFFMWATHDDLWEPEFAAANLAALNAWPGAVCSVSRIAYFQGDGSEEIAPDTLPLTGTPAERMRKFFATLDSCGRLYGVYRTEKLQKSFSEAIHIYGADWLIVALTLLEGDHLEVERVLLRRAAAKPGHYYQRLGKTDGFAPDRLDRLWPLNKLQRELKRRLPSEVWHAVKWPLRYVALRQEVQVLQAVSPQLSPALSPLRTLAASALHRRWREKIQHRS